MDGGGNIEKGEPAMETETEQQEEKMRLYRGCIEEMLEVIDRDIMKSDDLSLLIISNVNHYFEKTAKNLQSIITGLTTDAYDYLNKIIYLDAQHSVQSGQKQIVFPEKKNILIASSYEGRLKATKDFAEKYCCNVEMEYVNVLLLEEKLKNSCFDVIIMFENDFYTDEFIENELPKMCRERTKVLNVYKYESFNALDIIFNSLF